MPKHNVYHYNYLRKQPICGFWSDVYMSRMISFLCVIPKGLKKCCNLLMMTIHMTVLCLHTFRAWLTKLRKCNLLFFKQENQPVFLSIYATILNFWYKVFFFLMLAWTHITSVLNLTHPLLQCLSCYKVYPLNAPPQTGCKLTLSPRTKKAFQG